MIRCKKYAAPSIFAAFLDQDDNDKPTLAVLAEESLVPLCEIKAHRGPRRFALSFEDRRKLYMDVVEVVWWHHSHAKSGTESGWAEGFFVACLRDWKYNKEQQIIEWEKHSGRKVLNLPDCWQQNNSKPTDDGMGVEK